eukprot:gene5675-6554_t
MALPLKPSSASSKPVEWGAVGRTVSVAKTSMLQKMGKAEVTQAAPQLVVDNIKTKALKTLYDETLRMSRKIVGKLGSLNKATEASRSAINALATFYAEGETGAALQLISALHAEHVAMRVRMEQSIQNRFIAPADIFLTKTIIPAREAKDRFRKARLEYDSALGKLRIVLNATNIDAKALFVAQSHHAIYRRRFLHRQYEAQIKLSDAVQRHGYEYLVQSINLLACQHDYYAASCARLAENAPQVAEMRAAAQRSREEHETKKATEEARVLSAAKEREENKYNEIVEIFSSADLAVVNAICLAGGSDQEAILEDLVRILDAHKQMLPIIKLGITKEVQSTNSAATLFRGNSTATKLMTAFTRMTGRPYLIATLKPIIERLVRDPAGLELDPDKVADTTGNCSRLMAICQEFLDAIYNSIEACPLPFREMANHLQSEVVKIFPESKYTSVGGFFFLRFFCPCILSPDANGVVDSSSLTMESRRALILVSKVLQNVSNGLLFGTKETYMKEMNPFLDTHMDECRSFLDNIAALPRTTDYVPLASIEQVKVKELPSIHRLLTKNLEKIFKTLGQYNQQSVTFQLVSSLGRLGECQQA